MAARDDFSAAVKDRLAQRVGQICSRPSCGRPTSGPRIDGTRAINVGVAAHITAAAREGPRYDPLLTAGERSSIDNAIWLCQVCAKLIDSDPPGYPTSELLRWKAEAEAVALERMSGSANFNTGSRSAAYAYLQAVQHLQSPNYIPTRKLKRTTYPLALRQRGEAGAAASLRMDALLGDVGLDGSNRSLWIQGEAGSGKTTTLCHIARSVWSDPKSVGLQHKRLPLYVRLPAFAQSKGAYLSERLLDALGRLPDFSTGQKIPDDFFDAWPLLLGTPWLLLFDGLDEVPSAERVRVIDELTRLMNDGHQMIIASRPLTDDHELTHPSLSAYVLEDLNGDDRLELSTMLLGPRGSSFLEQLNRLEAEPVRTNILLFTLAALLFDGRETLPTRRNALYAAVTAEWRVALLNRAPSAGSTLEPFLRLGTTLIGEVALAMTQWPDLTRVTNVLPIVAPRLARYRPDAAYFAVPDVGISIMKILGETSSVFEVVDGYCGWMHATFREYFAAISLAGRGKNHPDVIAAIDGADDPAFRQILLMMLLEWFEAGRRDDVDHVLALLATRGEGSAVLAGQALREGVQVTAATEVAIVETLALKAIEDANESLCNALLTSRFGPERLTLLRSLKGRPHLRDVVDRLLGKIEGEIHGNSQDIGGHSGWAPQWFSYLGALDGHAQLLGCAKDARKNPDVRLQALHSLACAAPNAARPLLESIVELCIEDGTLASLLISTAFALGRDHIAIEVAWRSAPGWRDAEMIVKQFEGDRIVVLEQTLGVNPPSVVVAVALWDLVNQTDKTRATAILPVVRAAAEARADEEASTIHNNDAIPAAMLLELTEAFRDRKWHQGCVALMGYGSRDNSLFGALGLLAASLDVDALEQRIGEEWLPPLCATIMINAAVHHHFADDETIGRIERLCASLPNLSQPGSGHETMGLQILSQLAYRRNDSAAGRGYSEQALTADDPPSVLGKVSVKTNAKWLARANLVRACWHEDGDPAGALALLEPELVAAPWHVDARRTRGLIRYALEDWAGVIDDLEFVRQYAFDLEIVSATGEAFLHVGEYAKAVAYSDVVVKDPDWRLTGLLVRGAARMVTDWDGALEDLDAALGDEPGRLFGSLHRAYLRRLIGDVPGAVADARVYLETLPDHFECRALMSELGDVWASQDADTVESLYGDQLALIAFINGQLPAPDARDHIATASKVEFDTVEDIIDNAVLARLSLYSAFWPDLGDHAAIYARTIECGGLLQLIEIAYPLALRAGELQPDFAVRAAGLADAIRASAETFGGSFAIRQSGPPRPSGDYPFPMYCAKIAIGGLEPQRDYCARVLTSAEDVHDRAILFLRLDGDQRVYGACTFKREPDHEYKFKFCDLISTVFDNNIEVFVREMRVRQLLFVEPELLEKIRPNLQGRGLPVELKLMTLPSEG